TVSKGGIVGEMAMFDVDVSESAKALVPSRVQLVDKVKFDEVMGKIPSWFRSVIDIAVKRLKKEQKRSTKSSLRSKQRGVITLVELLYPLYKKNLDSKNILDYEFVVREAYFVCRLHKRETQSVLAELGKRGFIEIHNGLEELVPYIVIPDIEVLSLYSEFLLLKSQNRAFAETLVPDEEVETLENIVAIAEAAGDTGAKITISKKAFLEKCKKDSTVTQDRLIDLKIRSLIEILPGSNGETIVFERKHLDRIQKIRSLIPKFETEQV
ncbi:MAG: hypothetical protein Q4F84_08525, partial [Fibrobacter sp.]|nr:hypothetical protein [Fibrobacter sp.]